MPILDPQLFVRERKRQRLSMVDMSARTGIRVARYSEIESGADASQDEVAVIASALGVAVRDIDRSN